MDIPNAFIGMTTQPTDEDVSKALGPSAPAWNEFLDWIAEHHSVTIREWNSYSPKHGWSLRLKIKKRNIVYLSPCDGCFRVAFILGDKAVAAARQNKLSKPLIKLFDEATHYPEGTGLRLLVKGTKDLAQIQTLAAIKLAN